jgi:CBS domain-containing protein
MHASDIMTSDPRCCSPNDSLRDVAQMMRDIDCGAVPVVDNGRIIGIVTDRDLVVRALASGRGADAKVGDVITSDPRCCGTDDDLRDVEQIMAENQVRRVPIVDADGHCVGIVSQADLALAAVAGQRVSEREVAVVVERISAPRPHSFDRGAQPSAI